MATEQQLGAGLSPAIALTQQMLEMVQHQQWDALALLENQRRLFLEKFFFQSANAARSTSDRRRYSYYFGA